MQQRKNASRWSGPLSYLEGYRHARNIEL